MKARVACNALPLLAPRAGIARYLIQMTGALRRIRPEFDVGFFHLGRVRPDPPGGEGGPRSPLGRVLVAAHAVLPLSGLERAWLERAFRRAVVPERFDLYHETHFAPLPFDGPTVLTVYDLSLRLLPGTQPRPRVALFEKTFPASLPTITRFLAISEAVKRELCAHFPVDPDRVAVTPLGCDARLFRPARAGEPRPPELPRRYLLAVGTLEPRKNAPTLLAAYGRLPRSLRAEVPLLWAGPAGWKSSALERLARMHGVEGQVRWVGVVDDERLARLYRGATAFVFPTLYEGFGLPGLEALACGTPVVCSDAAAVVEVAGDAALVVRATDVAGWAAALARILEDEPLRARLAAAGPVRARAFSWEACAELTARAYEAALAKESSTR